MEEIVKKLIGEIAGIDEDMIVNALYLEDDLSLDENDLEELFEELENYYDTEFDGREDREFEQVSDIITYLREIL